MGLVTFLDRMCIVSPWMEGGKLLSYLASKPDVDIAQVVGWVNSHLHKGIERSPSVFKFLTASLVFTRAKL